MSTRKGKKKMGGKKKKPVKVTIKVTKKGQKKKGKRVGMSVVRRVSAPVAKAASFRQRGANVNGTKHFRVHHREMLNIMTSAGTVAWVTTRYNNNPGIGVSFPWLSLIAQNFKEYRFRRLTFHYEPNCPSTSTGAIVMIPLYNPADPTPLSVNQAMDLKNAVNVPIWQKCSTSFSGQKFMKNLFVRTGTLPASSDYQVYDSGSFVIAMDNVPVQANFGKLIVEYEVDFYVPYRTAGFSTGYGVVLNADIGTISSNMFFDMNVSVVSGEDWIWYPPSETNNDFIQFGNSNLTQYYLDANTVKFTTPGFYVWMHQFQYEGVISTDLTSITYTGCGPFIEASTYNPTITAGNITVSYGVVAVVAPGSTMLFNWSTGTVPQINRRFSVYTINSAMFQPVTTYGGTVPVVMNQATRNLLLTTYFKPEYFYSPKVHVVSPEAFRQHLKDGKIPKRSDDQVLMRLERLRLELKQYDLAEVQDSEEDEVEVKSPTPGPRVEVKQSEAPPVAPVARSASSGIGSYVGAVLGRKADGK